MEIAKNIDADYYNCLNLDLSNFSETDWNKAIHILELRLNERFVEPADKLIEIEKHLGPNERKYGFAILALDFLLTETLQSFIEGYTESKNKSQELFVNFLTKSNNFKNYFQEKEAVDLYIKFRCGILHQAQTFGDSRVWSVGELFFKIDNYTILNRNKYHSFLKKELDEYFTLLKRKKDKILLENFKKKMDFISKT